MAGFAAGVEALAKMPIDPSTLPTPAEVDSMRALTARLRGEGPPAPGTGTPCLRLGMELRNHP